MQARITTQYITAEGAESLEIVDILLRKSQCSGFLLCGAIWCFVKATASGSNKKIIRDSKCQLWIWSSAAAGGVHLQLPLLVIKQDCSFKARQCERAGNKEKPRTVSAGKYSTAMSQVNSLLYVWWFLPCSGTVVNLVIYGRAPYWQCQTGRAAKTSATPSEQSEHYLSCVCTAA